MIWLDSSWLVKLYVEEVDSAQVRAAVDGEDTVLVSEVAFVEFHAAVARRRREGSLSGRTAGPLIRRFRRDWPDRNRATVSPEVVGRAADLLLAHPLRSLDAIQLASALLVAAGAPEPLRFGAADARLLAAARAEGLRTLTVE
jgi:predicted nucleic acid-binding protein